MNIETMTYAELAALYDSGNWDSLSASDTELLIHWVAMGQQTFDAQGEN